MTKAPLKVAFFFFFFGLDCFLRKDKQPKGKSDRGVGLVLHVLEGW